MRPDVSSSAVQPESASPLDAASPGVLALEAAYAHCAAITRREGRNFAWGFVFLSARQRRAMTTLYAFARVTDDIVDDESASIATRAERIAAWREATVAALDRGIADDPTLRALGDMARAFAVPREELLLLVDGCRDDLTVTRFERWDDTLLYCRKVAVAVGICMLAIFDARGEKARAAMEAIGYAFQLTNILRDIPEDARRDRVYLPQELLARHGVVESELGAGPPSRAMKAVMKELAARANEFYDAALPLDTELASGPARTMRAMRRIYRGILVAIEREDYDVWKKRPRVSTPCKMAILARTACGL